ncbi:MAG: DNA circularization N-terminal domain-containing protein [Pseudomonadota bacterium]
MTWRETIKGRSVDGKSMLGSFRGARFIVPGAELTAGRRTEVHEYPGRDLPYVEDLGRRAREFPLEVFVDGSLVASGNYLEARDALIAAVEKPGAGTLVHPWYGTLQVSITDARVREATREGGRATFTLTCIESGELAFPETETQWAAKTEDAAATAEASALADFASIFNVDGLPEFHLAEIETELGRTLAGLEQTVGAVTDAISAEIRAPYNMGGMILGSINRLADIVTEPLLALRLYQGLFGAGNASPTVPTTTTTRRQQAASIDALHAITQRGAVICACRQSASMDYASRDDALAIRSDLLEALDTQMESAGDAVYQALADLRTAVAEDLRTRGARLPQLRSVTPPATLPALLLAYRIHGDASRDAEIVSRNKVRHPGFVPGGVELEALSE